MSDNYDYAIFKLEAVRRQHTSTKSICERRAGVIRQWK